MTKQEAQGLLKKHGSIRGAARAEGMTPSSFRRRLNGQGTAQPAPAVVSTPTVQKKRKSGLSESEFLDKFDVNVKTRNQLKDAVRRIERKRFYPDHEMRRLVGCGDCRLWRDLANDPNEGFSQYQFKMRDAIYWSDPESVANILKSNSKASSITD